MVDARGLHSFVCKKASAARQSDTILWMTWLLVAFQQLAFPSSRNLQAYLVPTGNVPMLATSIHTRRGGQWCHFLFRCYFIPWQNGKGLCWDVTVICPLADSYISAAARDARAAAELAASRKEVKYAGLDSRYNLLPLPSRTWEYQALQLASSFQTLAEDWLTFREKAATPVTCFRDAQSWYSALKLFFCMTVCQIVTARITRHTQLFVDFPNF